MATASTCARSRVGLQHFRDELGEDLSPPTVLGWAAIEQPELDSRTPADWVAGGRPDGAVLAAAARAAAGLAR